MKIIKQAAFLLLMVAMTSCALIAQPAEPAIVATEAPATPTALQPIPATATSTPTPTEVPPTPPPTIAYPIVGYGPGNFPTDVNPLTGLEMEDPSILDRRPVLVKVQNLPRADRPHWGISAADIVYEYYTEYGTTRFGAIYYGEDSKQVAPIRSARHFDVNLIRAYKAMFIFGSAYEGVYNRLISTEFFNRLMVSGENTAEVMFRYDPSGKNHLMADTSKVNDYAKRMGIENGRQDLDGMFFQMQAPLGGKTAEEVYVRFSGAIYNRWDYDEASGNYLRYSDADDALGGKPETYEQVIDRVNDEPITAENVVMIYVYHQEIDPRPEVEVLDISLLGTGTAYILRDGKMYDVTWSRPDEFSTLTLLNPDGSPFPFKPGQTWFEIMAFNTNLDKQDDGSYRFTFISDW